MSIFNTISISSSASIISFLTLAVSITTYLNVAKFAGSKVYHNYLRDSRNSIFVIISVMFVMIFNRIPAPFFLYLGMAAATVGMLNSLRLFAVLSIEHQKNKMLKKSRALMNQTIEKMSKIQKTQADLIDVDLNELYAMKHDLLEKEEVIYKGFFYKKTLPAITSIVIENAVFFVIILIFMSTLKNYY